MNIDDGGPRPGWSRPVAPGRAAPDVMPQLRIAAFAAGLGEIGYSKMLLTPEFGPRQRFGAILTNAPLEPDPIFTGKICDRCMQCVKACSGNAISKTETVKITIAGHEVEWGKLDEHRCRVAFRGGKPETNPFAVDKQEPILWHGEAVEGARGCTRACMIHLEEKGVLKNKFKEKFRKKKPWELPADWKKDIEPTNLRLSPQGVDMPGEWKEELESMDKKPASLGELQEWASAKKSNKNFKSTNERVDPTYGGG